MLHFFLLYFWPHKAIRGHYWNFWLNFPQAFKMIQFIKFRYLGLLGHPKTFFGNTLNMNFMKIQSHVFKSGKFTFLEKSGNFIINEGKKSGSFVIVFICYIFRIHPENFARAFGARILKYFLEYLARPFAARKFHYYS